MNENKTKREYNIILKIGADCGQFFNNNRELKHNDGNGSENVPQKVNSRCVKLHRSYSNIFICQILAIFSGVEFERNVSKFKKQKNKKKFVVLCSRPP